MQGKLRLITQVSLALAVALSLLIAACGDNDVAAPAMRLVSLAGGAFGGGSGTPTDPYIIEDIDDLQAMQDDLEAYYALAGDIDASATSGWNTGQGFAPIGDADNRFSGGFDGRGFTITGLYINRPNTNNVGLFGHVGHDTGTTIIKNVGLIDASIVGARGVGTLIGRVTGNANTLIENCFAEGGAVTGNGATGGLIGSFNSWRTTPGGEDNPILRYSFTHVSVESVAEGGGRDKFGGLVGCSQKGTIQNSYSRSSVTVTNGSRIGGLAGCVDFRGEIFNSYSTGLVDAEDSTAVGGLVGNKVGPGFNVGVVTNSFWDTETSKQTASAGGTGKTTGDMKTQDTFTDAGWNFDDIWSIDPEVNDGYPYLVWQDFEPAVLTIGGTFTARNKVYDGTNDAEFATEDLTLEGTDPGHDVTLVDVVIRFADPSVGDGKIVYITSAALAGADAGKYTLSLQGAPTATADVTPRDLTITADDKTKVYSGTAFPVGDFTVSYEGFVAGEGPGDLGGTLEFEGPAVDAVDVGTYGITPSGLTSDNYAITFEPGTLTLDPRPITVTANDQTKLDGETFTFDHGEYEITAGSLVSGHTLTLVLSSDGAAADAEVGDYDIDISDLVIMDNGTDVTDNYDITPVEGTLTVTEKTILTITGGFTALDKTYDGTRDAQFDIDNLTLHGVEPGDTVTLVEVVIRFEDPYAGDSKTVYITSAALSGPDADKYVLSLAGAPTTTASIIALTIEVTAHEKAKVYGAADPALTYGYSPELVGSDTFIGALTRQAGEDVGTYEIRQGSLALSDNYILEYTSADLTITPLTIYVTADAQSKVSGEPDPELTYTFSPAPLPLGDSFTGELQRDPGEDVGTYAIRQGTLALGDNYILDYSGNYLTITDHPTYTISGTITVISGLADVEVVASGGHEQTVYTDSDGKYELTDVAQGATDIVITPTLAGYTFSPTTRTVPGPVTEDVANEDFTAQALVDPEPIVVGWDALPVNKLAVLAPWIALCAAIMAAASLLMLRRRRTRG